MWFEHGRRRERECMESSIEWYRWRKGPRVGVRVERREAMVESR